ncbi:Ulp1 protease [Lasiodiplodia theobromae]|uniref:Ulp1 protease n=1 Tax=Lasiodiplodia theobromae TaxID=45133 RepID=UPI0015C2C640|nr:Ulp1 protease [Lasiodiplodia theobromae]KAF4537867.1 Ulp1 protease [Lasiodiplodia theobromae]
MARLRSKPTTSNISMPASGTRSMVATLRLRPRVKTALRSGANERATPAPADDDPGSDEGIEDDEYEENADKVEELTGLEYAGAPFPRLARKLAASKWELDNARFLREFSPGMWRSRDFMRQLVDWAETGTFSLEDALKAMAETRRHQANGTRPAQKGGDTRLTRINRKRRWTPQCLTNALVDLQENGLELDSLPPPPREARRNSSVSIEAPRRAAGNSLSDDLSLLQPHLSPHDTDKLDEDDTFQFVTSDEPGTMDATSGHTEDGYVGAQEGEAVDSALGADLVMKGSEVTNGMALEVEDGADEDVIMVDSVPLNGRAHSHSASHPKTTPPTDVTGAASSLLPGVWVSGSAIDFVLRIFANDTHRIVSNTFVDNAFNNPKALEEKSELRLKPEQRQIVLPLHLNTGHWTMSFLELDKNRAVFADSLASSSQIPHNVASVLKAFVESLGTSSASEWTYELSTSAKQSDNVECGVHALVFAIHRIAGVPPPTKVNAPLWRLVFRAALLASGQADTEPQSWGSPFELEEEGLPAALHLDISTSSDRQLHDCAVTLESGARRLLQRFQELKEGPDSQVVSSLLETFLRRAHDERDMVEEVIRALQEQIASANEFKRCMDQEALKVATDPAKGYLLHKSESFDKDVRNFESQLLVARSKHGDMSTRIRAMDAAVEAANAVTEKGVEWLKARITETKGKLQTVWDELQRRHEQMKEVLDSFE